MTHLRLTLACDHYDLLWPMKNGTITPEGIDLQILTAGLAWASALWEEERAILGEDPWAYNVRDNLNTIQRIIQYAFEDGLISTRPDVGDLFAENVLDV